MKKKLTTVILIIILIIGLLLLFSPMLSRYFNSLHQTQVISGYMDDVSEMTQDEYGQIKEQVRSYNKSLVNERHSFINDEPVDEEYKSLLNFGDNGMIGYISIGKIDVQLPIYHGTSETVLANGIGHFEGSSLPLGGSGTHCVLTGHSGLQNSELFTNLDKLDIGDTFTITVLDEVLVYEVDNISVVEPDDDSLLAIDDDEDYVTLLTCTPYGVNTHRLLVRGKRVNNDMSVSDEVEDAALTDTNFAALLIAVSVIGAVILIIALRRAVLKYRKNSRQFRND